MTKTMRPWELHAGNHVRWEGAVITVTHDPELDCTTYHIPAWRNGHKADIEVPLSAELESADLQPAEFRMSRSSWDHVTGDTGCAGCWSDAWPVDCMDKSCGGLVHAEFEDESEDSIILAYQCDRCGSTSPPSLTY